MGLDMYLTKKSYVQNWDHTKPELLHEITIKRGGEIRSDIKPERITYIIEEVAYWRKANQIHRWFVDNVQGGNDDCGEHAVDTDQLRILVDLCKQVLETVESVEGRVSTGTTYYPDGRVIENTKPGAVVAQKAIADALLPTQGGFFFGSTDYDEYYLEDLKNTVRMLEPLTDDDYSEFYYHSSW